MSVIDPKRTFLRSIKMKSIRNILYSLSMAFVVSCGTPGVVNEIKVEPVKESKWENTSWSLNFMFIWPVYEKKEQTNKDLSVSETNEKELVIHGPKPASEFDLSENLKAGLSRFREDFFNQLPMSASLKKSDADYDVVITFTIKDTRGPIYVDEKDLEIAKRAVDIDLLTPIDLLVKADFDVLYDLTTSTGDVFQKSYTVIDSVDHQESRYGRKSNSHIELLSKKIFRNQTLKTSNKFLEEAAKKL